MSKNIKLYHCPAYLFCNYELLEKNSNQIAKECNIIGNTILKWLRKFNIRIRTMSESKTGNKHHNWKENNSHYDYIHRLAHKVQSKPIDNKCQLCNKVKDKQGITKLVHSNKDHSYKLPINSNEWWWIHDSCHKKYDSPTTWTLERRKEHSENHPMKKPEVVEKWKETRWSPERRKEQSEWMKENNPMKKPEVIEKANKTKRKSRKIKSKIKKNKNQLFYWLKPN